MDLPEAYTTRSATMADAEAVTALANAAELVDLGETMLERSDVEADWASPTLDLDLDVQLVFAGDRLVASAQVSQERADVDVHPDVRGRGIGSALIAWTEDRARQQVPAGGTVRVGQTVPADLDQASALFRSRGYGPLWDSWILRLPDDIEVEVAPPNGVTVRPYQAPEEHIAYEIIDAAFSEWEGRDTQSYGEWQAMVTKRPDFDPTLLLLAIVDGRAVGAAYGINYPGEGWVDKIAVDAAFRGRGIATALLATLFAEFRARGERCLRLNTDSRTGALDLYRNLGMVIERTYTRWSVVLTPPESAALSTKEMLD